MSRAGTSFGQQGRRDLRQLGPGGGERVNILGLIDLVAERNRLARPQPQQIARRQRADDAARFVDRAEMADLSRLMRPMAR